jgi:hypothetical protein
MPRLVFGNITEFAKWADNHLEPSKHEAFHSSEESLYVVFPRRATQPVTYAVVGYADIKDQDLIVAAIKKADIPLYAVERVEWNTDRGVGIKMPAD